MLYNTPILLFLIFLIHKLIVICMFSFWIILPLNYLHYYIFFLICLIIQWLILNDHCMLTIIEYRIMGKHPPKIGRGFDTWCQKLNLGSDAFIGNSFDNIGPIIMYSITTLMIIISYYRLNHNIFS